jgi:peptidase M28-like protein
MRRFPALLLAFITVASAASAQAPTPVRPVRNAAADRAAGTITEADVRRRVFILADDSMRGRNTPSPELDEVAAYIAAEFRRFGLRPAGDSGTFFQRYSVDRVQAGDSAVAIFRGVPGGDVTLAYKNDFVVADNSFESGTYAAEAVVLAGSVGGAVQGDTAALAGKFLIVASSGLGGRARARIMSWQPAGVVLIPAIADSLWPRLSAGTLRPQLRDPLRAVTRVPVLGARPTAIAPALTRAGVNLDSLRLSAGTGLIIRPLPGVQFQTQVAMQIVEHNTAPNVIGVLEGSDAQLKSEYVVFSAHMDHVGHAADRSGCSARGADSICNGADDDGSGTVAVVELAEAFSQLRPRPKRSMVFMTVSGEEKGLWGSAYFSEHPTLPLANIVANLNIDMIGRNWKDTVSVIGREHSDLGTTLDRVAAAHPELGMTPVNDLWPQENFYFRSDHYNFARKGVPILFFFTGTHPDYHQVTDHPDKIDAEKESRIARLVFYLALEVANAVQRPQWNAESYKRIVEGAGR